MIHIQQNHSTMLYDELFKKLQPILSQKQLQILGTVEDATFPGAIIPTVNAYYVIAPNEKTWYELLPLLKSFLGPSVISGTCMLKNFTHIDDVERLVASLEVSCALKIDVPKYSIARKPAARVFEHMILRLYDVYKQTEYTKVTLPVHTSVLVENFQNALYRQDRLNAYIYFGQIKNEHRLDALNIKFLEIEFHHAFSDWESIINIDNFEQIMYSRKPLRVRMHLIETYFYVHIENFISDFQKVKSLISRYIKPLLGTPCPENALPNIKAVYFLAYIANIITHKEIAYIEHDCDNNQYLSDELKAQFQQLISTDKPPIKIETSNPQVEIRAAIIEAENDDTLRAKTIVQKKLEQDVELSLDKDEELSQEIIPVSWKEWIESLELSAFTNFHEIAERGVEEWILSKSLNDPKVIRDVFEKLSFMDENAITRFSASLPYLMNAIWRDPTYPNPIFINIYMSLLSIISLRDIQDQTSLYLTQDITGALLATGPSSDRYIETIEFIGIIIDRTNGTRFINWLIDFSELLISENCSNIEYRNKILEQILNKLYEQGDRLLEYQYDLVIKVASILNLVQLFDDIKFEIVDNKTNPWDYFTNLTIGIYTLSESAAKHAKEYLEDRINGVKILLNHDHAATDALRNMAHTSDILVLVTQAAKHAATGEIQKILRQRDLDPLFPIGKGSSSIISRLLEHAQKGMKCQ